MSDITRRKSEHIDIVASGVAAARHVATGFDDVRFAHCALPELNLADIDLSTRFLGRTLSAPYLISSMTGGPDRAGRINAAIAEAAQSLRIGFGVGSQRVALENAGGAGLDRGLRKRAPDVPILANLGAIQILGDAGRARAQSAVDMLQADALIVHLNPLQEAVQSGGDTDWRGVLAGIEALVRALPVPVVVKEVGCGLTGTIAGRLADVGVTHLDVAGAGGTSWAAVEAQRGDNPVRRAVASAFHDWGVPTVRALIEVRKSAPEATLIASGGIRDGLDAARAIRLGADVTAQAAGVLDAAMAGPEALVERLHILVEQLRVACFCTGSRDIAALRRAPLLPSIGPVSA